MKNYYLPYLIGALCLVAACRSEDETPIVCSTPEPPNYYPLAVGNYWIYEWFSFTAETPEGVFFANDTLRVTAIEEINGKEYFRLERSEASLDATIVYRRDSMNVLVDEGGRILFSKENPGVVFQTDEFLLGGNTPWISVEYRLKEEEESVEVTAGTFDCLVKVGQFIYPDPEDTNLGRSIDDKFAPDIGIVKGTRRFSNPNAPSTFYYEFRLINYHIE